MSPYHDSIGPKTLAQNLHWFHWPKIHWPKIRFAMCVIPFPLAQNQICYVCYVLTEGYRYCVKSVQFGVKLVGGYFTILVVNNENLLTSLMILVSSFRF